MCFCFWVLFPVFLLSFFFFNLFSFYKMFIWQHQVLVAQAGSSVFIAAYRIFFFSCKYVGSSSLSRNRTQALDIGILGVLVTGPPGKSLTCLLCSTWFIPIFLKLAFLTPYHLCLFLALSVDFSRSVSLSKFSFSVLALIYVFLGHCCFDLSSKYSLWLILWINQREEKAMTNLDSILRKPVTNLKSIFKSRDITLPTKVRLVKAVVFPVVMYGCELDHKESWAQKNWCFWTVVL